MSAASLLDITIVNIFSLKPFDKECLINVASGFGNIVTIEEHNIIGGLPVCAARVSALVMALSMMRGTPFEKPVMAETAASSIMEGAPLRRLSSDMGIALIDYVANKYDTIVAHYFHMNDKLSGLREKYREKLILIQADFSTGEDIEQVTGLLSDIDSALCHVVHLPAKQIKVQKFPKIQWGDFEVEYNISVRSIVRILQTLLPTMAKEMHGRIVIMLSDAVVNIPPKYSADYVTTKYALLGLVRSLAIEYADNGITVNGISPTFTETKFIDGIAEFFKEEHRNNSPIGRNLLPEDIIPTIAMLLSDEAMCINGQNIPINCGR